MKLKITRKIIDAIHNGELENVPTENSPIFNFQVPTQCPGVPSEILNPRNTWADKKKFDDTLKVLAAKF